MEKLRNLASMLEPSVAFNNHDDWLLFDGMLSGVEARYILK
jgi:hypothetical protein